MPAITRTYTGTESVKEILDYLFDTPQFQMEVLLSQGNLENNDAPSVTLYSDPFNGKFYLEWQDNVDEDGMLSCGGKPADSINEAVEFYYNKCIELFGEMVVEYEEF